MADIESGGKVVDGTVIPEELYNRLLNHCGDASEILEVIRGVESIRLDLPKSDPAIADPITCEAAVVRQRLKSLIEAFWVFESQAHAQRDTKNRVVGSAIEGITSTAKAAQEAAQDRETLLRAGRCDGMSVAYAQARRSIEDFIRRADDLNTAVKALTISQKSALLDIRDEFAKRSEEESRKADAILKPED